MGRAEDLFKRQQAAEKEATRNQAASIVEEIRRALPLALKSLEENDFPSPSGVMSWNHNEHVYWEVSVLESEGERNGDARLLSNGVLIHRLDWKEPYRELTYPYSERSGALRSILSDLKRFINSPNYNLKQREKNRRSKRDRWI